MRVSLVKLNDKNVSQNDFYNFKDHHLHTLYNQEKTQAKTKSVEFNFTSPEKYNVEMIEFGHSRYRYHYNKIEMDGLIVSRNISVNISLY